MFKIQKLEVRRKISGDLFSGEMIPSWTVLVAEANQ